MTKKILLMFSLLLAGCQVPKSGAYNLRQDSTSYNKALQSGTDSQMLLNIVRLRYRDTPTFLQVGTISAAYETQLGLNANAVFSQINRATSAITITPSVIFDRKEKPTTTFSPVRGEGFVKEFLSPMHLHSLVLLNSSGWRIDRIMRCCMQRLNGVKNAPTASGPTPKYAPEFEKFHEVAELFAELERRDAIDLVTEKCGESGSCTTFLHIERDSADPAIVERIWDLLEVDHGLYKIKLVAYHGRRHRNDEIVVDMRSPLSLLYFLSQGVHVPQIDQAEGKVTLTQDDEGYLFDWDRVLQGLMTIHSGPCYHPSASVGIHYRGSYFYIDDADLDSKSTFSLLTQLLALQIKAPEPPITALTIPLNS